MDNMRDGGVRRTGPAPVPTDKGLIRSLNRSMVRSKKARPIEAAGGHRSEPAVCEGCGAVFFRRLWRQDRTPTAALLARARWTRCPACTQAARGVGFGRVVIRGRYALANEAELRRRITNVAARAAHSQPERRISSVERVGDAIEVITTSQRLAHRIAHELKKAFRGRTSYAWSDDGTLHATWKRD